MGNRDAVIRAVVLAAALAAADDQAAFERWVQPDSVEALELLLAAPASRHPASLWGHVLLRVRYREDVPSPAGFAPVFQLGVEDAPKGEEVRHTFAGVFGGLEAKLFVTPSHKIERRYRTVEGRGLKVYELELDADERRRVLERLWIASRDRHRWDYAFFTDNCAGLLAELVGPALAPELELGTPHFIRWPSSTLDRFARARRADGRPLLRYLGEEPGSVDRARDAASARREAAVRLRDAGAPLDGVSAREPQARAAAYATLGSWAGTAEAPGAAEDAAAFLSESMDVELGEPLRRAPRKTMVAALGDALAALPAPPPRPPVLRTSPIAIGASGGYTARIAGGAVTRDGETRGALEADVAILDESLGDVRERGFRPDLGLRLLGFRARVERDDRGRAVLGTHEWTFAALDSVRGGHGPSVALRGFGDAARGVGAAGFAEFGRAAGFSSRDAASGVVLSAAATAGVLHTDVTEPAAGARARLATRVRTGATSLDRIEVSVEADAFAVDGRHGWIARAELGLARTVGDRDRPSVLRVLVRGTTGPALRERAAPAPEISAVVEWQLP